MDELERLKRVFYDYTTELQVCENITCNIRAEVIDRHELTVKIALECMVHYLKKITLNANILILIGILSEKQLNMS